MHHSIHQVNPIHRVITHAHVAAGKLVCAIYLPHSACKWVVGAGHEII